MQLPKVILAKHSMIVSGKRFKLYYYIIFQSHKNQVNLLHTHIHYKTNNRKPANWENGASQLFTLDMLTQSIHCTKYAVIVKTIERNTALMKIPGSSSNEYEKNNC